MILYLQLLKPSGGTLAQLVEQRTENPCVPGSIPGGTTQNPQNYVFEGFFYEIYFIRKKCGNSVG